MICNVWDAFGGYFTRRPRTGREFVVDRVERVVYNPYKVTLVDSVPVQSGSGHIKLQFRIEGEIDQKAVRSGTYTRGAPYRRERRKMQPSDLNARLGPLAQA
jgi:hypothetical protein